MNKNSVRKTPNPPEETNSTKLKLVPGGGETPKTSMRLLVACVSIGAFLLGGTLYYSHRQSSDWNDSLALLNTLSGTYRKEGLEQFASKKRQLKVGVEKTLRESHDEGVQREARNVAVYLFPELLEGTDFEKGVANAQWLPLEQAIEKKPADPQSRFLFEDLRATLWNYENPERSHPVLSSITLQVIQIYDTLSTP